MTGRAGTLWAARSGAGPEVPVARRLSSIPVPPTADPEPDVAARWPVQDHLELGALPGAVPCARLHARHILWEWRLAPLAEAVEHVVSELMANAVTAARDMPRVEPVRLWLLTDTRKILVLVWDASPRPPAPADAGADDEGGRGLFLVEAFSERWGTYPTPHLGGKVVWAMCGPAVR